MARPRKRINNTPYPDHVIDAVARTFYPKLLEDWLKETSKELSDSEVFLASLDNTITNISVNNIL